MASRSLGTLTLDIIAQVGGFVAGMDKAERSSQKWRKEVEKSAKAVGLAIGAGVAAGVTALAAFTVSTVQTATEIRRLSSVAGSSTTEFQKYAAGAKTVGVENDKLADIFKDVNDKVGDFLLNGGGELQDFFKTIAPKVGVTADQFRNLSGPQALQLFASSLQKAGLSQAELTQQMEALANDATLLLPLLRDNGAGFAVLGEAAEKAGAIMDESTIRATQDLAAAGWLAEQSMDGIKNQLAASLMPTLSDYAGVLFDLSQDTETVSALSAGLKAVLDVTAKAGLMVAYVFELTARSISGLVDIAGGALDGVDFSKPVEAFNKIRENSSNLADEVGGELEELDRRYNGLWQRIDQAGSSGQASEKIREIADALNRVNEAGAKGTFSAPTAEAQAAAKAAENAAKKLQSQFDTSEEGYRRQIALINTEVDKRKDATEVAKLQFEVESGKLKGISSLQQAKLKGLAEELDKLKQLKIANEDNAKAASYASTLAAANATAQSGLNMEFVGAGMGSKTRERLQGILEIRQEFDQKYADLQAQRNSGDISEGLFKREAELLQSSLEERLSMQVDYYSKQDELQTNWLDGAKDAWQDYADHARDLSSQMYDVTSNALGSLEDELVGFVKTGEFNFSDFAEGIADDLLHMLVKVGLQMAVNAAIGDAAAASSAALAAATGTAMAAAYAPAAAMASLASFGANAAPASAAITSTTGLASSLALVGMAHDGIDSVPREGTWLLQKGERVTTAGTSAKLDKTLDDIQASSAGQGGGSSMPAIQQQIIVQGTADEATLARIKEAARQGAQLGYQMVLKDFRSNGPARQQLRKG
ncbi:phage tail tape measure protein [Pseudomonas putida]|uniref:phage tail tape measure protein n=1 Tax=Pseudomonas putida TaxID=303 RepID=UPI0018DA01E6|nr:phage tail tape measure protein [Pseudomonas putida]MBH3412709.1 phage tail tape measure protein [Pseudomonas putida]